MRATLLLAALLAAVPAGAADLAPRCACSPPVDPSQVPQLCHDECRREGETPRSFCEIGRGAGRRSFPFRSPICQRKCRRDCRRFVSVQQGHCCEPPLL